MAWKFAWIVGGHLCDSGIGSGGIVVLVDDEIGDKDLYQVPDVSRCGRTCSHVQFIQDEDAPIFPPYHKKARPHVTPTRFQGSLILEF